MLPLLRDHVLIVLAPTHLSMVRMKGVFGQRQVIAKHTQKITAVPGQTLWQPVIEALSQCLKSPEWHNANLKITIANSLVRYALLPWSETILNAEEEQKFIQFKMDEVFGISDKGFEVSLGANNYCKPRLACSIETALLNTLHKLAAEHHLQIQSIQPQLVSALNFWRKEFKAKQFYFMFADREKLCTTFIKEGHLQHLRMEQISGELTEAQLESTLQREHLINPTMDESAPVYLYTYKKIQLLKKPGQSILHLHLPEHGIKRPETFLATVFQG